MSSPDLPAEAITAEIVDAAVEARKQVLLRPPSVIFGDPAAAESYLTRQMLEAVAPMIMAARHVAVQAEWVTIAAEAIHNEGPAGSRTCGCQSEDEHETFLHDDTAAAIRALEAAAPHLRAQAAAAERERLREPVAVISDWLEHLPVSRVPLRVGEAVLRLRNLAGEQP